MPNMEQKGGILPSREELDAMGRRRHQMPTPFVHGSWWVINYRTDVYEDGLLKRIQKQKQLCLKEEGRRKAESERDDFISQFNHGGLSASAAVMFKDYVSWVYKRQKLPLLEPTSQDRYKGVLDKYLIPQFETRMLRDVTFDAVQALFTRLAIQPQEIFISKTKTVQRILDLESRKKIWTVLSSVLEHARLGGHINKNPCEGINLGRSKRGARIQPFVTPQKFAQLVDAMAEPYATMVYVAVFTGLRVSELAGLKWRNLDDRLLTIEQKFSRGKWGSPKSEASNASIAIGASVQKRIFGLKQLAVKVKAGRGTRIYKVVKKDGPDDLVFQSVKAGRPMNDGNILRRHIRPAGEKIGIPWVNWLALRRSTATWHKRAGTHVKDAQHLMRHEHEGTTLRHYTQIELETQLEAVDKLEQYFEKEARQIIQ